MASDPPLDAEVLQTPLKQVLAEVRAITRGTAEYPTGFEALPDPPPVVFARGKVPVSPEHCVAIVGSRAASAYGLTQARRLAADLAGSGITVVSGFARGIDTAAHRGALEGGGVTVAVLASGLDEPVPFSARELLDRIAGSGGLISERAGGPAGFPAAFLHRNRLIAALCRATVVVEAARKSGARSTASWARKLGRTVLAVPGDVDRETSRGCIDLLREGALPCTGAGDVLSVLGSISGARSDEAPAPAGRLGSVLSAEPKTPEVLAVAAGLPLPETLALLTGLEWSGVARRVPGARWVRSK